MRRTRCKRNMRQSGGGLGGNVEFAPGSHLVNNDLAWKGGSSCVAAPRPGFLDGGYTGAKGLPGMSGGRRRKGRKNSRRNRRNTRRVQSGGRYGMGEFDGAGMGTPWGSGLAPTAHVPCEASNTPVPDSGAANTLNMRGSSLWDGPVGVKGQLGGGQVSLPALVTWPNHGAGSGSPSEMVPTARYTDNAEPGITTAAGTKLMIHTPLNWPEMNPACVKTGGGRKRSRRSKKAQKKSRKNRK